MTQQLDYIYIYNSHCLGAGSHSDQYSALRGDNTSNRGLAVISVARCIRRWPLSAALQSRHLNHHSAWAEVAAKDGPPDAPTACLTHHLLPPLGSTWRPPCHPSSGMLGDKLAWGSCHSGRRISSAARTPGTLDMLSFGLLPAPKQTCQPDCRDNNSAPDPVEQANSAEIARRDQALHCLKV
jgi:hypothetical protein